MTEHFLFELGCEELPAGQLALLSQHLHDQIKKGLDTAFLTYKHIQVFYTPRRLAVLIDDLALATPARTLEKRGPAKAVGFDFEGKPSKALEGFLKSVQATLNDLLEVETDKGIWLAVNIQQPAVPAASLLPEILMQAIKTMPIKKTMRWGSHDFSFLRPVSWIVALLGQDIVPLELFGQQAGRITRGHRFHHPELIQLGHASEYQNRLRQAFVMVDQNERRQTIQQQSMACLTSHHSLEIQWRANILEEVVNLVEWPVALLCRFNPEFLEVPQAALIATMDINQRVFSVTNPAGKLQPYFITIANLASTRTEAVIEGNEKVVGARLADARFFYQEDLKIPLEQHLHALEKITFQQGLGSLLNKTQRLENLVDAPRAAQLCKADLVTQMVQEFPELQGYMGHQYALLQGEAPEIAAAIEDHYKPKGKGGDLPRHPLGMNLALFDKLDTLVGLFAINKEPSSSGDPYALRRQALGVIAILVESKQSRDLYTDLVNVYAQYQAQHLKLASQEVVLQKLVAFFEERMEVWFREEKAMPVAVIRAILNSHHQTGLNPFAIFERIQALNILLQNEAGQGLQALAKRVANILDAGTGAAMQEPNPHLFQPEEANLWALIVRARQEAWLSQADVQQRYVRFLEFKPVLSAFFEAVMVNDPDAALRHNRQVILQALHQLLMGLADFSML
jgi:glycyl-tRNA synthetase beta chain